MEPTGDRLMSKSCKKCRHFHQFTNYESGHCRRYPPVVLDTKEEGLESTVWPVVNEEHWCGEYFISVQYVELKEYKTND